MIKFLSTRRTAARPSGNSRIKNQIRPIPTGWEIFRIFLFHDVPILLLFGAIFAGVFALLELIVYGQVKLWPDGPEPSRADSTDSSDRAKPLLEKPHKLKQHGLNHSRFRHKS